MKLILASTSPRRDELLRQLGLAFEIVSPDIDETRNPGESPAAFVERLAREKAMTVVEPDHVVVAADTVVVHAGRILGKPGHPAEARTMLSLIAGETHDVFTGMAVAYAGKVSALVDVTEVEFMPLTDGEIARYVSGGEPMDKAGAYALQGEGGRFVQAVRGSPSTVVGLPIHLLERLVRAVGADLERFKATP